MGAEAKAKAIGIKFDDDAEKGYLNMVARVGHTLSRQDMFLISRVQVMILLRNRVASKTRMCISILESVHQKLVASMV